MSDFKIKPSDIDTRSHFWGAFDNNFKEVIARLLIVFFQERSSWDSFDASELDAFFKKRRYFNQPDYCLENHWISENNGRYEIEESFINICYRSSPQKQPEKQ
jgi:hypothetical protein